jgi:hypothetical protein
VFIEIGAGMVKHPRDMVAYRHELPDDIVVWHVEKTKHESELREALGYGYGEPICFYDIQTVMEKLGLVTAEDVFYREWGDVCYLISNGPLSDEQLLAQVKEYAPSAEAEP